MNATECMQIIMMTLITKSKLQILSLVLYMRPVGAINRCWDLCAMVDLNWGFNWPSYDLHTGDRMPFMPGQGAILHYI